MIEITGWISSILFAICAAPQAYSCYKQGHGKGISQLFMWLWLLGEIFIQIYVIGKHGFDLPLLVNYWGNTIFILIIMRYMYLPRSQS